MSPRFAVAVAAAGLALGGCALTSKSEPLSPRYFELGFVAPEGRAQAAAGGPEVRLGKVSAASHVRERRVRKRGDVELSFEEEKRWTERPEAFLRRGLARVLYEEQGYRQALSGAPYVVDCELVRLEEIEENGVIRKVVVGVVVTIHDERRVLVGDTFVAEEPVADAEETTVVRAYAKAMRRALDHVAEDLAKAARATPPASAQR
jgi:cholesterol transport system auxiliary component